MKDSLTSKIASKCVNFEEEIYLSKKIRK